MTAAIDESGTEAVGPQIDIARVFAGQVRGRAARNFRKIDENDDELVKSLADHAYQHQGYRWDIL